MKLTKTKRSHSVMFNITPMIDIVFLLIIFFMTVSQITRVVDQPLPLPQVSLGAQEGSPASVTINIDRQGQLIVANRTFSLERTIQILSEKLRKSGNDPNQIKIELRCDKRCPSEHVNEILEQLASLGFEYVKIAVSGEQ